ncbi:MAG: hypothetical protein K0Q63_701 [Paenibacillus sp.]|nr:hypothetical protein [Paenibacillus sp.]
MLVCPECAHEWNPGAPLEGGEDEKIVKDANGNALRDGDSVTVIKDLKVKGTSLVVKIGTKVKNIRSVHGFQREEYSDKIMGNNAASDWRRNQWNQPRGSLQSERSVRLGEVFVSAYV